jgi:hypothetical protein
VKRDFKGSSKACKRHFKGQFEVSLEGIPKAFLKACKKLS